MVIFNNLSIKISLNNFILFDTINKFYAKQRIIPILRNCLNTCSCN